MEHLVINRPESVEFEHLLVPFSDGLHFTFTLVSDNVINYFDADGGQNFIDGVLQVVLLESRKEAALIIVSLDESVDSVTIGLDGSNDNSTMFILQFLGFLDRLGTFGDGML